MKFGVEKKQLSCSSPLTVKISQAPGKILGVPQDFGQTEIFFI